MRTTFEWASKITKDNKTKDFIGMYVAIKIGKIDCYMQLDLGCPHTFLMEDFIKNYIPEFENKKKSDLDWYGKGMPHLENIKLTLAKGKINSLKYCFIEKDLTKKETKNEETILKKKLPFAGFF